MSKQIKQMEMADLHNTFQTVRDLGVLHVKGLNSLGDYTLRASLRKKKIRLKIVKNSLTRRVFKDLGMDIPEVSPFWQSTTVMVWSTANAAIAELCRDVDTELNNPKLASLYKEKVTRKGAIADGQAVAWEVAVKMKTRLETISEILGLILSPGAFVAGCLQGPGGQIAGQIATLSEKKEEGDPAPA
jgi:ribosomal protein L10